MIKRIFSNVPIGAKLSMIIIGFFLIVAFFASVLANDIPIYLKYEGESYYPIFSGEKVLKKANGKTVRLNYKSLNKLEGVYAIYPIIPFKAKGANIESADYLKPLTKVEGRTHLLGTNLIGEDTLAGLIHGARFSLKVGILSMLLALLVGLLVGSLSGYFGNSSLKANVIQIALFLFLQVPVFFYVFVLPKYNYIYAIDVGMDSFAIKALIAFVILISIEVAIVYALKLLADLKIKKYNLAIDNLFGRLIELVDGMPMLMILISLSIVFKPSAGFLILFIGLTGWITIARFTRAEVLKLRNSDFMSAIKLMNMPTWRIIFKHLLPNVLGPAMVAFAFGVGNAILAESSLSFLGVGLPSDVKTWGMILDESRAYYKAWWLVWSPGICIFLVILSFYNMGQFLRSRLNPESVQM